MPSVASPSSPAAADAPAVDASGAPTAGGPDRAASDPGSGPAPDPAAPLRALLAEQRAAFARGAPDLAARRAALATLADGLRAWQEPIVEAVAEDFGGRAREETLLYELFPALAEIGHTRRHLARWMRPRRVRPAWFLLPATAHVRWQPLGVVGVLGAWNYQLLLSIGPIIGALAAGNHVMVKPSEVTPRTADVIARLLAERFPRSYVAGVTGGPEVAAAFSALPFDHLFFTGSTRVGHLVMRAASEHLVPVTLELGGKSPAIVHREADLARAARRIMAGKLVNAGQTCVAPDYVLVPHDRVAAFVDAARQAAAALYPRLVANADYTRVVTRRHWERLAALVAGARAAGAQVVEVNPAAEACSAENRVFAPTLVVAGAGREGAAALDALPLMQEEIFGPVLPVIGYDAGDSGPPTAAMAYVNARARPLALYYFDDDGGRAEAVLEGTTSGGALVNDVLLHLGQPGLPFGGVGPSGMGHYHGRDGFETFSKKKGVMVQRRLSATALLQPPYGARTRLLLARLLRLAGG